MAPPPARKPNRVATVPVEYRRDMSKTDATLVGKRLSEQARCEIVPIISDRHIASFHVFGPAPLLDDAMSCVNDWIENARAKTKASASWAKMPAFDNNKWYYDHVKEMEIKRKQQFKGEPPEGAELYSDIVDWPKELRESGFDPMSVFGPGLAALDSIRTEDEVFIAMCPHRGTVLQIEFQAYDEDHLASALERFRNMVRKVQDKSRLAEDPINIILDEAEGSGVALKKIPDWWPSNTHSLFPQLVPINLIDGARGEFRKQSLGAQTLRDIQNYIVQVLEVKKFEQGSYDLAVRYGCLSLGGQGMEKQVGHTFSQAQYLNGIKQKVSCIVNKWFDRAGDHSFGGKLLHELMAAHDVLEPARPGGPYGFGLAPSSLPETRPTLQGTWVLQDPNNRQVNVVVQINWTEDEEGAYEKMPIMYFRIKDRPSENLDINLMELGAGKSWHFGLESMQMAKKSSVSPAITSFAEGIKIKPEYGNNIRSPEPFATWSTTLSTKLMMCRLHKIYTFLVQKTKYNVEAHQLWYPGRRVPCWGLYVRHSEWSTHLNPLETLPAGRAADFGKSTAETFFPKNGCTSVDTPHISHLRIEDDGPAMPVNPAEQDIAGISLLCKALMRLSVIIQRAQAP
ncbi:hypothetical protein BCR34DRAFT_480841 [Clohesyomyces aquaticus]|uniref:DUF7905 domain-containing protein n=1 Tax=Clohesyomyces aquaticus TaxID=1231657 RepID=A0A1Y1ZUQ7_9PLEO|nr:hypothetical protein BCR34DRAFT_480841 [Clohesyomyces aquaticus]